MHNLFAYVKRRAGCTELNIIYTSKTLEGILDRIANRDDNGGKTNDGMYFHSIVKMQSSPNLKVVAGRKFDGCTGDVAGQQVLLQDLVDISR